MFTRKNIRAEVASRDLLIRRKLNCGPVLRVQEDPVLKPEGNGLLPNILDSSQTPGLSEVANLGRESSLAPADIDGPFEGCNVVFLHDEERKYTRKLVDVNKNPCFTENKETCTVLVMPALKKKAVEAAIAKPKRRRKADPEVGPDGRTLGQRLIMLMSEKNIGQTELARLCSQHYATFVPNSEDKVAQQHIFNLIQGQNSGWAVPLIAAVFDVSDMWLQYGIGPRTRCK